ncbi:transcriptional regulator [Paenibacillus albus]|uniref:Transcriptional regulator n=1 Tax=Paenibacillus albus TaxID=2495582 RepID=A0A3Q8X7U0_9BACL|nr:transcriptional regulator [Paenibacillus albus]AZN42419.1 transcriptional regulator [Paenibacillus albus]
MILFVDAYEQWLRTHILEESNSRRRELLEKGLGHGTREFLRIIWYPAVRNFNQLYPEWEVRDFNNGYRYVDLAYLPVGGMKGAIEIQGYGPHAWDLDVRRFKDLCWRHSLLALDDWILLPIAYLSISEETQRCQQLVLSFIGKFVTTTELPEHLGWLETESVRFARRLLRPFTPTELAAHLRVSDQHARRLLHKLVDHQLIVIAGGAQRYRTYAIRTT